MAYPRAAELALLAGPTTVGLLGFMQLHVVRGEPWTVSLGLIAAAIPGTSLLIHGALLARRPRADCLLLPIVGMLSTLGLLIVYRIQPALGERQAQWLLLGAAGVLAGIWLSRQQHWLLRYRYSIGLLGLLLTAATLLLGVDPNGSGARLWFTVAGVSFQPVELLKVLLVFWVAGYLYEHGDVIRLRSLEVGPLRLPPVPYLLPLVLVLGLTELLLVVQRDLGAGLLISVVFTLMIYVGTGRVSLLGIGLLLIVGAGWLAASLFEHVGNRVTIWLDPWSHASGPGYQIIQGLIALAHGGILGTGLGLGMPGYVPAVHTDFSIVAVSEELGLAGSLAVVALYALLLHRGFQTALSLQDGYSRLLAAGLTTTIGVQTLIILGGVLRLLPLTGITLPWVSYGGSSIVVNALMLGMLLGLSHQARSQHG